MIIAKTTAQGKTKGFLKIAPQIAQSLTQFAKANDHSALANLMGSPPPQTLAYDDLRKLALELKKIHQDKLPSVHNWDQLLKSLETETMDAIQTGQTILSINS